MSVLTEIAMFPLNQGASVSTYVSKVIDIIRKSGVPYKLNSMGTVFETETLREAHALIEAGYATLEPDCERVYITTKIDIKKSSSNNINSKLASVESKIGTVDK